MLCPKTHPGRRENVCSSYQYFCSTATYTMPCMCEMAQKCIYINKLSLTSNQLPRALARLSSCPALSPAAPVGFTPLPWLGAAAGGSRRFERGETGKLSPLCLPRHGRDTGNGGGGTCVGRSKAEHVSSPETLDCSHSTHPAGDAVPGTCPACCPHLAWWDAVPRPGTGGSSGRRVTASPAVLSQNLERHTHRSSSPCFQHSWGGVSLFFFFFPFGPWSEEPSAGLAITQLCHDICDGPCPHSCDRPREPAVSGDSCSSGHADTVASGRRCRSGSQRGQEPRSGQWQAWERSAATPYARQTLKGKANWVYLAKLLNKWAPVSWRKKGEMS